MMLKTNILGPDQEPYILGDRDARQALMAQRLAGPALTATYLPSGYGYRWSLTHRKPVFTLRAVQWMVQDPRVAFGLGLIKGPLVANAKLWVECQDATVKQFLVRQVNRFWQNSSLKALQAIEWGYSGCEVLYEWKNNMLHFDTLKWLHPWDTRVVTRMGKKAGILVRRVPGVSGPVYLHGMKGFWHLHKREVHPWYGVSRLLGAYSPWYEMWTDGGGLDVRRLYYYKYAYSGDTIYFPPTSTATPGDSTGPMDTMPLSNRDQALRISSQRRTGGTAVFPNIVDENGNKLWEIVPAENGPDAGTMLEYVKMLQSEILEGMLIPPEIARAEGTGAYAGRKIPLIGFMSSLQELLNFLAVDLKEQILEPLVRYNFGKQSAENFDVAPYSIFDSIDSLDSTDTQQLQGNGSQDQTNGQPGQEDGQQNGQPQKNFFNRLSRSRIDNGNQPNKRQSSSR